MQSLGRVMDDTVPSVDVNLMGHLLNKAVFGGSNESFVVLYCRGPSNLIMSNTYILNMNV